MKAYSVFNIEQIEDLPAHYYAKPEPKGEPLQLIETAERFFAATGAVFRHGGNMAYYAPRPDLIQLPPPESFRELRRHQGARALPLDETREQIKPGFRAETFWRYRLCPRGACRRTRSRFPVCGFRHHARAARGSRRLSGSLAQTAEGRQMRDLFRCRPRAARA
jgi:hypothetical protein